MNARIQVDSLTDQSKVYSVIVDSADGGLVVMACTSERAADELRFALNRSCIDVSLRD